MSENHGAGDFLLHPADRIAIRRHAKMRIFVEADRLTALNDDRNEESREAIRYLGVMKLMLDAVGWANEDPLAPATGLALNESILPAEQLRAWIEQHFLPEDKSTLADAEGDPSLNLGRALDNLGATLSLLMRLRQRLAGRHEKGSDEIVKDAARDMAGETALELARTAKRLMDEAEKLVGLPVDSERDEKVTAERARVLASISDPRAHNESGNC